MLMLDPTTLFFWDLSNASKKAKGNSPFTELVSTLPKKMKESSCTSKHSFPSLLLTNQSTLTTESIHTFDQNNLPPLQVYIKPEADDDYQVFSNEDGQLYVIDGISDRDEVHGEEREEAIKSLPKGLGTGLRSEVRVQIC